MPSTPESTRYGFRGDNLYQQRARRALPILVRQAKAAKPIEYGALAAELGMKNARNLNFPLGAIGNELLSLAETWNKEVPPIQALVINQSSGLPGDGIDFYAPDAAQFRTANRTRKRAIVDRMLEKVYSFQRWDDVLAHFGFEPAAVPTLEDDPKPSSRHGEESPEHKALKHFIASHPDTVGAPASTARGETEFPFRSGDRVDVLFRGSREWIATEVKSERSSLSDIERGLFQCVKYEALLEATLHAEQRHVSARAVPGPRESASGRADSVAEHSRRRGRHCGPQPPVRGGGARPLVVVPSSPVVRGDVKHRPMLGRRRLRSK